jgi:hypothetical protein
MSPSLPCPARVAYVQHQTAEKDVLTAAAALAGPGLAPVSVEAMVQQIKDTMKQARPEGRLPEAGAAVYAPHRHAHGRMRVGARVTSPWRVYACRVPRVATGGRAGEGRRCGGRACGGAARPQPTQPCSHVLICACMCLYVLVYACMCLHVRMCLCWCAKLRVGLRPCACAGLRA